jgi:hypothetical protein
MAAFEGGCDKLKPSPEGDSTKLYHTVLEVPSFGRCSARGTQVASRRQVTEPIITSKIDLAKKQEVVPDGKQRAVARHSDRSVRTPAGTQP